MISSRDNAQAPLTVEGKHMGQDFEEIKIGVAGSTHDLQDVK